MSQPISYAVESSIAIITVDSPPVNAISTAIRRGLLSITRELAERRDVQAVVLLCAGRTFIAGADIKEFGGPMLPPELRKRAHRIRIAAAAHRGGAAWHGAGWWRGGGARGPLPHR